jgi:hypothetical protein
MIRYHQCGFWHNRSTTYHVFFICQILENKWEYNEAVHQMFINFKKANEPFRREVVCNILIEFDILVKMLGLIKMCLNETHSRVWIWKHLPDMFPIKNVLKQDVLLPLHFNFTLEYAIRRVQVN